MAQRAIVQLRPRLCLALLAARPSRRQASQFWGRAPVLVAHTARALVATVLLWLFPLHCRTPPRAARLSRGYPLPSRPSNVQGSPVLLRSAHTKALQEPQEKELKLDTLPCTFVHLARSTMLVSRPLRSALSLYTQIRAVMNCSFFLHSRSSFEGVVVHHRLAPGCPSVRDQGLPRLPFRQHGFAPQRSPAFHQTDLSLTCFECACTATNNPTQGCLGSFSVVGAV